MGENKLCFDRSPGHRIRNGAYDSSSFRTQFQRDNDFRLFPFWYLYFRPVSRCCGIEPRGEIRIIGILVVRIKSPFQAVRTAIRSSTSLNNEGKAALLISSYAIGQTATYPFI